jgi:hypothetical protein
MKEELWCIMKDEFCGYSISNRGSVRNDKSGKRLAVTRAGTYCIRKDGNSHIVSLVKLMHKYWGDFVVDDEAINRLRRLSGHRPFKEQRNIKHRMFAHKCNSTDRYTFTIRCSEVSEEDIEYVERFLKSTIDEISDIVDMDIEYDTTITRKIEKSDIPKEEWKIISEFPEYRISNKGRIQNSKGNFLTPTMCGTSCTYGLKRYNKINRVTATKLMNDNWPNHNIASFSKQWCMYIKAINDQPSSIATLKVI